jgi:hypothetical protein
MEKDWIFTGKEFTDKGWQNSTFII